jgi:hypothetical protein
MTIAFYPFMPSNVLQRVLVSSLVFCLHGLGYYGLSQFNHKRLLLSDAQYWDPTARIDHFIPFIPEWIWVYYSYLPAMILFAFIIPNYRHFLRYMLLYFWGTVIAFIGFATIPAAIDLPELNCTTSACMAVSKLRQMDAPVNIIPSLHAFHGTLLAYMALTIFGNVRSFLFASWGIAIVISALLTKQHALFDIIAGISLAVLLWQRPIEKYLRDASHFFLPGKH